MQSEVLICMYGLMAFTAVVLSIASVSWCEFIEFELPGGATPAFGAWRFQYFYFVSDSDNNIYKVDACSSNPDSWDMDTKWMSARVFGVLAPLLGTAASLSMFVSGKLAAGLLMLTTLFQGLTLLLLKSDLCNVETNPAFELFPDLSSSVSGCKLGSSGILSSVATAFFFVAAVLALLPSAFESKEAHDDDLAALGGDGNENMGDDGNENMGGDGNENKVKEENA